VCCGRKRQAMMASYHPSAPTPARQGIASVPASSPQPGVELGRRRGMSSAINLRYVQTGSIRVLGSVTGHQYEFSGERPVQMVHRGDANGLLRTGYFRRA
jgi:hypothetical protein